MTPAQCRAGRAFLGITQGDLAVASHVGLSTVKAFEKGRSTPNFNNLKAMEAAFAARGVGFIEGGVTLRR